MMFNKLLRGLRSNRGPTAIHNRGRQAPCCRPRLEALEDRCLPTITLVPSVAAPQLVGQPITWTATVDGEPTAGLVYQFSDGAIDGPFHVARDFSPDSTLTWAPMAEGAYKIKVTVMQGFGATDAESAVVRDTVNTRVTGTDAVITSTANPLVALYSAPPLSTNPSSSSTELMHVEFSVAGPDPVWQSTNALPVEPGKSTNFLVAGMLPNTTYEMRHVLDDGTASAPMPFTTGALPTTLTFPTFTVQQPPGAGSDLNEAMVFHELIKSPASGLNPIPSPLATDLQGRVVWYYDVSGSGLTTTWPGQSLVPGGTVLLIGTGPDSPAPNVRNVLREIDLAGNSIRETNLAAINAQLAALGQEPIDSFTHDVERLPNGDTAVIGLIEHTVDMNGTPTNYVGAMILVLDENFQVAWTWNSFDHLDVNRGPVLGEILPPGSPQPTAAVPSLPAIDWLHINAVSWSPADQNLVLSLRHQDWVIKIDYRNGDGDGHVIWRLGQGGDFTVNSTDANPWFSHQHDAHFVDDTTLVLLDNGNTRHATDPNVHSRGQVWKLDEQTMTATLVVNADLGSYSGALGAAERLANGDYSFTLGENGPEPPKPPAQTIEVTADGIKVFDLLSTRAEYRSFRMPTLYQGTDPTMGTSYGAAQLDRQSQGGPAGNGGATLATGGISVAISDFLIADNLAQGGDSSAGNGGNAGETGTPGVSSGNGQAGGFYIAAGDDASIELATIVTVNHASTSDDDVVGVFSTGC